MRERKYTVYCHISPSGKRYIGATMNLKLRWSSGHRYSSCARFYSAIKKYGWENIEHTILEEGLTQQEAKAAEKYYIDYYNTTDEEYGYNMIRASALHECETPIKEKISKTKKKRPLSEEQRRRVVEMNKSEWHRKRNSESKKGRPSITTPETAAKGLETKKKNGFFRKCRCVETGEVFDTIAEAAQAHNIGRTGIGEALAGRQATAGLLHWVWEDEKENFVKQDVRPVVRPVRNIDTGKVYGSIKEAAEDVGIGRNAIIAVCKKKPHCYTAAGYRWEYVEEVS